MCHFTSCIFSSACSCKPFHMICVNMTATLSQEYASAEDIIVMGGILKRVGVHMPYREVVSLTLSRAPLINSTESYLFCPHSQVVVVSHLEVTVIEIITLNQDIYCFLGQVLFYFFGECNKRSVGKYKCYGQHIPYVIKLK